MLKAVVDFMYGIDLPDHCNTDDAEGLLTMADLYLMEDLKDAVASNMASGFNKNKLNKDNILDIFHLAEKFTALKLKELCKDFIVTNINIANQVLNVDATNFAIKNEYFDSTFFKNDTIVRLKTTSKWSCNPVTGLSSSLLNDKWSMVRYEAGAIGRIVFLNEGVQDEVTIKWNSGISPDDDHRYVPFGGIDDLEFLTPSMDTRLFKE